MKSPGCPSPGYRFTCSFFATLQMQSYFPGRGGDVSISLHTTPLSLGPAVQSSHQGASQPRLFHLTEGLKGRTGSPGTTSPPLSPDPSRESQLWIWRPLLQLTCFYCCCCQQLYMLSRPERCSGRHWDTWGLFWGATEKSSNPKSAACRLCEPAVGKSLSLSCLTFQILWNLW
jgi:hypothetical protein